MRRTGDTMTARAARIALDYHARHKDDPNPRRHWPTRGWYGWRERGIGAHAAQDGLRIARAQVEAEKPRPIKARG
jgi:hypothetical protein